MATQNRTELSAWIVAFSNFAGILLLLSGIFQFFQGLAAVLNPNYFLVGQKYAFYYDVSTWGWFHIFWGILVALTGTFIFSRSLWARILGIIVAALSALVNFLYIPYYPIWSILIIALDITIISALSLYSED